MRILAAAVFLCGVAAAVAAVSTASEPGIVPKPPLGMAPAELPACLPLEAPATPPGLKALPGNANVTLVWGPQPSRACVDA